MIELVKSQVVFREEDHTYWNGDKELSGITSTLIRRAFPNKYDNVPPEVLARAAEKGHELHELIEYHDNFGTSASEHKDKRIESYERLKQENGLRTIANEYLVSDNEHYASSIDIVMLNENDEICLVDTKTTYQLDRESVTLQLSIYKYLFELQNPTLKVSHIYVLWLPNKDHNIAELSELHPVGEEIVTSLVDADINGESFDISVMFGNLPIKLADAESEIVRIFAELKAMEERRDELKKGLYDIMESKDIKSFTGSKVRLTRVLPTSSEIFDSARFKKENPDLYKEYVKTSKRNGSLKITVL